MGHQHVEPSFLAGWVHSWAPTGLPAACLPGRAAYCSAEPTGLPVECESLGVVTRKPSCATMLLLESRIHFPWHMLSYLLEPSYALVPSL